MADTAVEFLLENMMKLINSDNKLMLEAYEEKVIEKEKIEWLYEEMQFLRKFLKDSEQKRDEHEELKSLVAKIRDVIYIVEDIIDWFLLNAVLQQRDRSMGYDFNISISSSKNIVDKAQNICGSFKPLIEYICALNKHKTEVMGILSCPPQFHMDDKIADSFHDVIEEIKLIIKDAMEIYKNGMGLSLRLLDSNICAVNKHNTEVMGILSCPPQFHMDDTIPDRFHDVIEEIKLIIKDVMKIYKNDKIPKRQFGEVDWLYGEKTNEVVSYLHRLSREKICEVHHVLLSKEINPNGFGGIKEEIKIIIRDVMEIYENQTGLSYMTWIESRMCDKIGSLCRLSIEKIGEVDHLLNWSSKDIHNGFGGIIKEIKSIIEDLMEIHEKGPGMKRSSSFPLYDRKIRALPIALYRANLCEVDFLYHVSTQEISEVDRLYRLFQVSSYLAKKIFDRSCRSYLYHQYTSDWSPFCLAEACCHLFSTYEEIVDLAEKIRHSFDSIEEEIKPMEKELMKIYEKGLIIDARRYQMSPEFLHLYRLSINIVQLAEKISSKFRHVMGETNSIKTEVTKIYQNGLRLSWLESLMGDEIPKWFGIVTEDIKSIKREVMKIYQKKMYGIGMLRVDKSCHGASSIPTIFIAKEELVVGFDDETTTIMELLTEEHEKQLKVIPIIGMPGLGKTTLVIKVYNNHLIEYQFHIRAWTDVSQVYRRRNLLFNILSSANIKLKGKLDEMRDEELGEGLYKSLKGKKYLIVMDDIWECRAWDDMKRYFPNDNNESRIIFTSRHVDVASALDAKPHYLRFLNSDESWDLLRHEVFRGGSCPQELIEIGKQISKKCQGLPLAIVVIAGLLAKKDKTEDWWRHVATSVSFTKPEKFRDTLALSYNHLPYHLKPCVLYFGAFPEDFEIPVWKLIWLWIAEGFIVANQQQSLEEVAEDYMVDLIDRSLVIVSKKGSNGRIKACRVHDLLRDLCLRKAREDNFLTHVSRYEPTSSSISPMAKKQRRICISTHIDFFTNLTLLNECGYSKHGDPEVHSFSSTAELSLFYLLSFCRAFKLLRVLNLSSVKISSFPEGLQRLVHLRFLSFHVDKEYFRPSVSNFSNLETFMEPIGCVSFSHDIWKMVKLRHLYAKRFIEIPHVPNDDFPFLLDGLQTICKLDLCGVDERVLRWIPNLRKLTCSFMESLGGNDIFPKLNFLVHLETLNITYGGFRGQLGRFFHLDEFPPNLKSLTLSNFRLSWEDMSTLGRLPNLEVLKLSHKAFEGPRWDTSEGLFHKLKFLKFQRLDIKQWTASSDHFPILQTLVLDDCKQLEQIPSGLGDIFTLEMIRLWYCSSSAAHSARQIQNWQRSMGNDVLKIHIYPSNNEDHNEDIDDEDDEDDTR